MTLVDESKLTVCPGWCIEEKGYHGDLHESQLTYVDVPAAKTTIYIALAEDATSFARPSVTVHYGDNLLLSQSSSVMRSLAAALVAAADRAEGIRP